MKKKDVKIGGLYRAKISGTISTVRLIGESPYGGWDAINERTGMKVRIKTAAKLRCEVPQVAGFATSFV